MFSTTSLKVGDSWKNFGNWKKSFALGMASCWQIFLAKRTKFCVVPTGPKVYWFSSYLQGRTQITQKLETTCLVYHNENLLINLTMWYLILSRFTGFHMTSFKFKTKELFYFYEVLEQLKTNVCTDFTSRGLFEFWSFTL